MRNQSLPMSIVLEQKPYNQDEETVARRYALFLKEKEQNRSCCQWVIKLYDILQRCWNLIVPIAIRGTFSQYQHLTQHSRKCLEKVSPLSIEQNLEKGEKIVAIMYSEESLGAFVSMLLQNEIINQLHSKNIQICPLKAQDNDIWVKKLKAYTQQKNINFQFPIMMPIWRGLFDDLVMLGVATTIEDVCSLFIKQLQFQERIKTYLSEDGQSRMESLKTLK